MEEINYTGVLIIALDPQFLVTVYNPLIWHVDSPLRFPVEPGNYFISDTDQEQIPYQVYGKWLLMIMQYFNGH